MNELTRNYRVLVSVWAEGETVAENYKFKTELCDDSEELLEGIKNFTLDSLTSLEEEGDYEPNNAGPIQTNEEGVD